MIRVEVMREGRLAKLRFGWRLGEREEERVLSDRPPAQMGRTKQPSSPKTKNKKFFVYPVRMYRKLMDDVIRCIMEEKCNSEDNLVALFKELFEPGKPKNAHEKA
jgi:hypothetical protein